MAIKIAIWVTIMNEYRLNLSRYTASSYIHLLVIKNSNIRLQKPAYKLICIFIIDFVK
jgi:hypothetical protein